MRAREFIQKTYSPADFAIQVFESFDEYRQWWQRGSVSSARGRTRLFAPKYHSMVIQLSENTDFNKNKALARNLADQLTKLDQRDNVKIALGNKISIISLTVVPGDNKSHPSRVEVSGNVKPRTITAINLDHAGNIDTIELDHDTVFPEAAEFTVIGDTNMSTTAFFPDEASASKAWVNLWFTMNKLEGQGWSVENWMNESINEDDLDEMALPADWDLTAFGHDKSFKSRVDYAKDRATKIGTGSSRVAFIIPDNGRETVLKVAKNKKGLAQNEAELDILKDGYSGSLDIVIPLVDYDKENPTPTWIQTELAQKASEKQLCNIMRSGKYLFNVTAYAEGMLGKKDWAYSRANDHYKSLSPEDQEIFVEYANQLAELVNSTPLQMGDLDRAANWGIYNGKPVVIDLGYTADVVKLYWG